MCFILEAFPGSHGGFASMYSGYPYSGNGGADAWQEFTAPNGKKYYYNPFTQENTWEKPAGFGENGTSKSAEAGGDAAGGVVPIGQMTTIGYAGFQSAMFNPTGNAPQPQSSSGPPNKNDKSRPVTSNAVSGTPWCVVWTGDNKVFFYNPSTRTSIWERPPELYNRQDVDLLVSKPPESNKILFANFFYSKNILETTQPQKRPPPVSVVKSSDEEEDDEEEDKDDDEEEESEDEEPVKKKTRKEKK